MPMAANEWFWSMVDKQRGKNSCWLWTGGVTSYGYGQLYPEGRGRPKKAHRVAYELQNGPIPPGMCVCHRCDVRLCVRGDHLWLGTAGDNTKDMWAKGRENRNAMIHRGESHGRAKLTEADVRHIRKREASQQKLADHYGINRTTIQRIQYGKLWSHLD